MADESDTKLCNNCKRQIAAANFMMHEMHCKRHITVCEQCGEPIPKGEMEVHFEENHAKISCGKCGEQVEKMNLEEHEETSCAKKPQTCLYCDLEFPRNELQGHLDYCGSRTEMCKTCGQYIMLKDEMKHNESKCTYPPVKPAPTNNGSSATAGNNGGAGIYIQPDLYGDTPGLSSFTLNEFSRVLGRDEPNNIRPGGNLQRSELAARGSGFTVPSVSQTTTKKPLSRNAAPKNTNSRTGWKAPARSVSNTVVTDSNQDLESDYDQLLARHLAQDLKRQEEEDDDIATLLRNTDPGSASTPHTRNVDFSENSIFDVMLPCEFCGIPYPADDLVQHQSGCHLERIEGELAKVSGSLDAVGSKAGRQEFNNNPPVTSAIRSTAAKPSIKPSIVNDLRELDQVFGDPTSPISEEELMLPCEFCDELYPMDSLIQHQSNCDNNITMTPRVISPDEQPKSRPIKKRSVMTNAEMLAADLPNMTSRRHQGPPTFGLDDSDDEMIEGRYGMNARETRPSVGRKTVKPTGSTQSAVNKTAVNKGHYSSNLAGAFKIQNSDREPLPGSKVSNISSRTRSTLDSLLDDPDQRPKHDLLGNLNSREPRDSVFGNRNQRSGYTAAARSPVVPKATPKTRATAKVVQQELERYGPQTSNPVIPRPTRTTRPNNENAAPNPSRTRANVFDRSGRTGPTSRKKPDNS